MREEACGIGFRNGIIQEVLVVQRWAKYGSVGTVMEVGEGTGGGLHGAAGHCCTAEAQRERVVGSGGSPKAMVLEWACGTLLARQAPCLRGRRHWGHVPAIVSVLQPTYM